MKKAILMFLSIPCALFSQNNDNMCNYFSQQLKEKPLECIDKSKLKNDVEIYQFFKWSSFKEDYLIRIEKKGNIKTIVRKKINKGGYNQTTGEAIEPGFQILKERNLTPIEFSKFKALLEEYNFWQKDDYQVQSVCSDGSGVFVHALRKDYFLKMSNGNCSPPNEYLYSIYQRISDLFGL